MTYSCLYFSDKSAVRRNIVMSNYVTLRRQQPVCQFSWYPQRDMSPLWPVIKVQGDSTSDRQTVTSDGSGRGPAWPVITSLLQRCGLLWSGFAIFEIREKPSHSCQKIAVSVFGSVPPENRRFSVSVWKRHGTSLGKSHICVGGAPLERAGTLINLKNLQQNVLIIIIHLSCQVFSP